MPSYSQTAGKGREHLQALGVVHAPRQVAMAGHARRQHRVAGLRPPRRQALLPTANMILAFLSMLFAVGFMSQACKHSQLASHNFGRERHEAKRVPGCKDAKGFATLSGEAGGRACRRSASSIISMPICPVASSRHMRQLLVFMVGMRSTTGGLLHMEQPRRLFPMTVHHVIALRPRIRITLHGNVQRAQTGACVSPEGTLPSSPAASCSGSYSRQSGETEA